MRLLWRLAIISMGLAAYTASATAPRGPQALLSSIISYSTSERTGIRSREFLSFLAPRLRAAVVKDTSGPEIGVLDYDPFCQCQDNDGISMRIVSLDRRKSTALAVIETSFGTGDRTR